MQMLEHEHRCLLEKRGCFLGRFCLGFLDMNTRNPMKKLSNSIDTSGVGTIPCERL